MAGFLDQALRVWKKIGINQKITISVTIIALIVSFLILGLWARRPDYVALYSKLDPDDAAEIVGNLEDSRILYRLRDNGSTILVPSGKLYELRMQLASKGLPKGSEVGFEIFDQTNLGATDFVQRLNYQRALQGELMRTISQMDEVIRARVHIVMPEPQLFSDEQKATTASVVLTLRPGASLSGGQIGGITHLVASSVEGLAPNNITIINSSGNMLSKGLSNGVLGAAAGDKLELQKKVEEHLATNAQTMLDKVLGSNKAIVKVAAELDFERIKKRRERYDPETIVLSEKVTVEEETGSTGTPGGVVGTRANIKGEAKGSGSSKSSSKRRETSDIKYGANLTVENIDKEVGDVKRLSIAVFVRQKTNLDEDGKEVKFPGDEEIRSYEPIIKEATGYVNGRDTITVKAVPYETYALFLEEEKAILTADLKVVRKQQITSNAIRYGGLSLAGLALLFFFRSTLKKLTVTGGGAVPLPAPAEMYARETGISQGEESSDMGQNRVQTEIVRLAQDNPAKVSHLLNAWLSE